MRRRKTSPTGCIIVSPGREKVEVDACGGNAETLRWRAGFAWVKTSRFGFGARREVTLPGRRRRWEVVACSPMAGNDRMSETIYWAMEELFHYMDGFFLKFFGYSQKLDEGNIRHCFSAILRFWFGNRRWSRTWYVEPAGFVFPPVLVKIASPRAKAKDPVPPITSSSSPSSPSPFCLACTLRLPEYSEVSKVR